MGMGRAAEGIEILNARPPLPAAPWSVEEQPACFIVDLDLDQSVPTIAAC